MSVATNLARQMGIALSEAEEILRSSVVTKDSTGQVIGVFTSSPLMQRFAKSAGPEEAALPFSGGHLRAADGTRPAPGQH